MFKNRNNIRINKDISTLYKGFGMENPEQVIFMVGLFNHYSDIKSKEDLFLNLSTFVQSTKELLSQEQYKLILYVTIPYLEEEALNSLYVSYVKGEKEDDYTNLVSQAKEEEYFSYVYNIAYKRAFEDYANKENKHKKAFSDGELLNIREKEKKGGAGRSFSEGSFPIIDDGGSKFNIPGANEAVIINGRRRFLQVKELSEEELRGTKYDSPPSSSPTNTKLLFPPKEHSREYE